MLTLSLSSSHLPIPFHLVAKTALHLLLNIFS